MARKPITVQIDLWNIAGQIFKAALTAGILLWIFLIPVVAIAHIQIWLRQSKFIRKHSLTHKKPPSTEDWNHFFQNEYVYAELNEMGREARAKVLGPVSDLT